MRKVIVSTLLFASLASIGFCQYLDETEPTNRRTIRELAAYLRETRASVNQALLVTEGYLWEVVSANHTASAGERLLVDTTSSAITITLPASPSVGHNIWLTDMKGTWATNNVTLARNGEKIQGAEDNVTLSQSGALIITTYTGSTYGWTLSYTNVGMASTTTAGLVELATEAETQAGSSGTLAVTPAGLHATAATTTAKGVVELATDAETQTGTDTERAVTPAGLSARTATDSRAGVVELATSAETITGTDDTKAVTPAGLQAKTASTTEKGIVELATDAETITGTDTERAVTPAGLEAKVASTTAKGIVELATATETQTGTDDTRAVTPAGLAATTASETQAGVIEIATNTEAAAKSETNKALVPSNIPSIMASPGNIGSTSAGTGTFTTLKVTSGSPALGKVLASTDTAGNLSYMYPSSLGFVSPNLLSNASLDVCMDCPRVHSGSGVTDNDWTGASGSTPPNGWTAGGSGTYTILPTGGYGGGAGLRLTSGGTSVSIYRDISVTQGVNYEARLYMKNGTASYVQMTLSSSAGDVYGVTTCSSTGAYNLHYIYATSLIASATSIRVTITVTGGSSTYADVDNFYIYGSGLEASNSCDPDGWNYVGAGTGTILNGGTAPVEDTYVHFSSASGAQLRWPSYGLTTMSHHVDKFKGKSVSFGAYLNTTTSNGIRLCIYDSITGTTCSDYVTNDGTWRWVTVDADISSYATEMFVYAHVGTNNSCYLSAPTLTLGYTAAPSSYSTYDKYVPIDAASPSAVLLTLEPPSGASTEFLLMHLARGGVPVDVKYLDISEQITCSSSGTCSLQIGTEPALTCGASSTCNRVRKVMNSVGSDLFDMYYTANASSVTVNILGAHLR